MLVSGIGFVLAAHLAIPLGIASLIAFWGGSIVSGLDIVDLVIGWNKTVAETEKLKAETEKLKTEEYKLQIETVKLESESKKLSLETQKIELETKKLELERIINLAASGLAEREKVWSGPEPMPASSYIDPYTLTGTAERFGMGLAVSTHLVNRVGPAVAELTQQYPAYISVSTGAAGASASATASA